jgi:PleD family two-component response regulator
MMTGMEDSESIMAAYSIGATDFITKPLAWQTLAFKVHYVYRASQAYRDLRTNELRLSEANVSGAWEAGSGCRLETSLRFPIPVV